jgi:ankyrin repeat protein
MMNSNDREVINSIMNEFSNQEWVKVFDHNIDSLVTALILAIKYEDQESIRSLIAKQLDINERDDEGDWTPLMYAVHESSLQIVKFLVESGADVNLRGSTKPNEDFALNLAVYQENMEIFQYLLPLTQPDLRLIAEQNLYH